MKVRDTIEVGEIISRYFSNPYLISLLSVKILRFRLSFPHKIVNVDNDFIIELLNPSKPTSSTRRIFMRENASRPNVAKVGHTRFNHGRSVDPPQGVRHNILKFIKSILYIHKIQNYNKNMFLELKSIVARKMKTNSDHSIY